MASGDFPAIGFPHYIESDLDVNENIGINELTNTFSLYPNPVVNFIIFSKDVNYEQLTITSANGALVSNWTVLGNQINVEDLSPGVYYLNINNDMCIVL